MAVDALSDVGQTEKDQWYAQRDHDPMDGAQREEILEWYALTHDPRWQSRMVPFLKQGMSEDNTIALDRTKPLSERDAACAKIEVWGKLLNLDTTYAEALDQLKTEESDER